MSREVGVKALIPIYEQQENSPARFLFIQRKSGLWDIPGGRVKHGETLPGALAREVHEETGLVLSRLVVPRLLAVQPIQLAPDHELVRHTYLARTEGDLVLSTREHTGLSFVATLESATSALYMDEDLEALPHILEQNGVDLDQAMIARFR
jgi:8-oxo-dGTP pyrophosphatase MutT (NUDIX family)